jgi:pimeloyl-ACP methyl ester carboxylesterase
MLSQFKERFFYIVLVLIFCVTPVAAQDAGQVLRLSIGYNNLKKSAEKLGSEKRAEVEKLGQLASEATRAGKYGEALKHYYHAIVLLRGAEWTPETALSTALAPVAGGGNPAGMIEIAHLPQLVIHGDEDKIVPVERSHAMVEAAKKLNVEIKYLEIPGGDHDSGALRTFKEVFDWFDSHRRRSKSGQAALTGEKLN